MLDVLKADCILKAAQDFLGRLGGRVVVQRVLLPGKQFLERMPKQRTGDALDGLGLLSQPRQHLVDVGVAVRLEQFVEVLQRTVLAPADLDMLPAKPDSGGFGFRLVGFRNQWHGSQVGGGFLCRRESIRLGFSQCVLGWLRDGCCPMRRRVRLHIFVPDKSPFRLV